tara:strand:- start:56698 stop:58755 length:2058 start_codon:yes stop_codon:yes gene_type:complete
MAGINPDISTSSFKPLSLDEIMMVPLAKQKQEDQAQLALDEFAALESQALGPDKDYVSGQIKAFKKEAGNLSDQLMESGVDKSFVNKVRGLRNRKSNELSLEGKTGQAAAAYNQYEANKKDIMARKDLTAEQKRLGLQEALTNYKGVAEGGQYQDYVGTAYIDIMKKGRDIASKMTPQEIAKATGVTIDENGYYRDGSYVYKTLPASHIEKVVKQALQSDQDLMAYANELERLGIANAEEEIIKSAQSAGNVFQRKDMNEKATILKAGMQPNSLNPNKGIIDSDQPWTVMDLQYQDGVWNESLNLVGEGENAFKSDGSFKENRFQGRNAIPKEDLDRSQKYVNEIDEILKDNKWDNLSDSEKREYMRSKQLLAYEQSQQDKGSYKELKENLDRLRANNPILDSLKLPVMNEDGSIKEPARPWTDKEVYDIFVNGAKRAEKSMSKAIKPMNPNSTFNKIAEEVTGSGDINGTFATKTMKIAGKEIGGRAVIASQIGLDGDVFNQVMRNGKVLGFAPGHVDMPGAFAVQIEIPKDTSAYNKGDTPIIYVQNDGKARSELASISRMNEAIVTGQNYMHNQYRDNSGKIGNEMIITELNPQSKNYEAATIRSRTKYTKEEIDNILFQRVISPMGTEVLAGFNDDGTPIIPMVVKLSYDEEMQRSINRVTAMYDKAPAGSQVLGKSQKNQ